MPIGPPPPGSAPPPRPAPPAPEPGGAAPPPAEAGPRGRAGLAWLVILLVAGFLVLRVGEAEMPSEIGARLQARTMDAQFRFFYGYGELLRDLPGGQVDLVKEPLRELVRKQEGPVAVRLRLAVLAGDIGKPGDTLRALERLEEDLAREGRSLPDGESDALADLRTIAAAGGGPDALPAGEREGFLEELGWCGRLALAPAGHPDRPALLREAKEFATFLVMVGFAGFVVFLVGLAGAAVFLWKAWRRTIHFRFAAAGSAHGGVYAEAFAAWFLLFIGMSLAFPLLGPEAAGSRVLDFLPLLTLAAAWWPVHRGIPASRVLADLGLRFPENPAAEVMAGVASWVIHLPVLAAGFLVTAILVVLQSAWTPAAGPFDPAVGPSHPISVEFLEGGGVGRLLFLAAVVAPVVEEFAFRGLLYRHLREATAVQGRLLSALGSGFLSSLLFAAIHPQGWTAIPALMAVAWALVTAREWRDSLLAPIAAHALHNGLLVLVASRMLAPG